MTSTDKHKSRSNFDWAANEKSTFIGPIEAEPIKLSFIFTTLDLLSWYMQQKFRLEKGSCPRAAVNKGQLNATQKFVTLYDSGRTVPLRQGGNLRHVHRKLPKWGQKLSSFQESKRGSPTLSLAILWQRRPRFGAWLLPVVAMMTLILVLLQQLFLALWLWVGVSGHLNSWVVGVGAIGTGGPLGTFSMLGRFSYCKVKQRSCEGQNVCQDG